jgi:hypothetical protein
MKIIIVVVLLILSYQHLSEERITIREVGKDGLIMATVERVWIWDR